MCYQMVILLVDLNSSRDFFKSATVHLFLRINSFLAVETKFRACGEATAHCLKIPDVPVGASTESREGFSLRARVYHLDGRKGQGLLSGQKERQTMEMVSRWLLQHAPEVGMRLAWPRDTNGSQGVTSGLQQVESACFPALCSFLQGLATMATPEQECLACNRAWATEKEFSLCKVTEIWIFPLQQAS